MNATTRQLKAIATVTWLLGILALAVSCSSAPATPQETVTKINTAADYLTYGQNYYHQGNFEQAQRFFQLALELNTSVDNTPGIAVSDNALAGALLALGRTDEALVALAAGKDAAQRSKDTALILLNLNEEVQADLAQHHLAEAQTKLKAAQPFPDTKEGALLWQALGVVERKLHDYTSALEAFRRSLTINFRLGLKQDLASNKFMIGAVLAKQGQDALAFDQVREALELDKNTESSVGIGQDLRALGILAERLGRESEAWDYLVRSQRVFQAISLPSERLKTVKFLIPLAKKLNKPDQAAYYAQIQIELSSVTTSAS